MQVELTFERVHKKFPEVRESHGKNGAEFVVNCPFKHAKGGIGKMYISAHGAYYCQDCGASGDAVRSFFDDITSSIYGELSILRDRPRQGNYKPRAFARKFADSTWDPGGILSPGKTIPLNKLSGDHPARAYVESRSPRNWDKFDIRYVTEGQVEAGFDLTLKKCINTTTGRIVSPIVSGGVYVGWSARIITRDNETEMWDGTKWVKRTKPVTSWMHLPGMSKSQMLYNFDGALAHKIPVIVEGFADAWACGTGGMAYMGNCPSATQSKILKSNWKELIWIPDHDVDKNLPRFKEALVSLSACCKVHVLEIKPYKDPSKAGEEVMMEMIEKIRNNNK